MFFPVPITRKPSCRKAQWRTSVWPVLMCALVTIASHWQARQAFAVDPPPDGGYPNENTAEGDFALSHVSDNAARNTGVGYQALSTAASYDNTAIGAFAMSNGSPSSDNTACGSYALYNNSGQGNTAMGALALKNNDNGIGNTALGLGALTSNTSGDLNTATGAEALRFNTTGSGNTADGRGALDDNTTGASNTAVGQDALYLNRDGSNNTAIGFQALSNNIGDNNTAVGQHTLSMNYRGSNNTAFGQEALNNNITGSHNIAIGSNAGANLTTGDHNIDIYNQGIAGESDTIRIGRQGTHLHTHIAGIYGATVAQGVTVIVDKNGQLGTMTSSERFKTNVQSMTGASRAILELKPVTFRYREQLDPSGTPQFGLIAEEVEKVSPELVNYDSNGYPYSVRYEAVNAMLLNEFLKAHRIIQELQATVRAQAETNANQQKQINELTATIEKVSAHVRQIETAQHLLIVGN